MLLAILRLGAEAYGTPIRHELEERTGRSVTVGALYSALERLERRRFVRAELDDPTPQRGGRARRYDTVLPAGRAELRRARLALARMWDGPRAGAQMKPPRPAEWIAARTVPARERACVLGDLQEDFEAIAFAGATLLLVLALLLATLLPARRAARVDAAIALRGE